MHEQGNARPGFPTDAPSTAVASQGGMPTPDEFLAVSKTLYDADEFFVDPLQDRVLGVLNSGDGATTDISYENAGRLLLELTNLRYILECMLDRIGTLEKSGGDLLDVARSEGCVEIVPRFNKWGNLAHF